MTRSRACRRCIAAGILTSALLHAGVGLLWLRGAPAQVPGPETLELELDLAMLAPETPDPGAGQAEPLAQAPPPPVAESQAEPVPQPDPVAESEPIPEPVSEPQPELRPEPEPPPKPAPRPELRPKPKPRPPEKRPVQRAPPQGPRALAREPRPAPPAPVPSESARPGPGSGSASAAAGKQSAAAKADAERAYLAELQRAISRHQRFPEEARRRHRTGTATVAFLVQADGGIRAVSIAKSSGDSALDQAAMQALQRLGRFKPIPVSIGRASWSMRVPIRFDLR